MHISQKLLPGSFVGNYRLEEIVQQRTFGALFLARHSATKATYLLRFIAADPPIAADQRSAFLDHAGQYTQHLQTLRHPYIVSIMDADPANAPPFFVYPHIPTRTLNTRVEQVGPLDLATIGRYLDQLAAALEYAHEHNVIHGALTPESIFLQLDGRLAVGDFGVQHILESARPQQLPALAYAMADSAAPEQLRGQQAAIASDVYGLGAILYYLLTGYPLYGGRTLDEIAYQTLNAPVPKPSLRRPDLPRGIDDLLAQALAKSPDQRLRRPGILANAFHRLVAPRNPHRVPFVESDPQPPAPPVEPARSSGYTTISTYAADSSIYGAENSSTFAPPPPPLFPEGVPYPPANRFKRARLLIGAALAVIIVLGGTLALINRSLASQGATGTAYFFDAQGGHSNGLHISISGLAIPPSGFHYAAWLVDEKTEQFLPLGQLVAQQKTYTLRYQGNATNLLGAGNRIEVTTESSSGQVPLGKVALSGTFPPDALVHLRHLMWSFPGAPGQIGLLVGAEGQTKLLAAETGRLRSADPATAACLIQSMLNIVEGKQGAHYQPLSAACQQMQIASGDGFGLLPALTASGTGYQETGYLEVASAHAELVIQQPDSTPAEQAHAQLIITAMNNVETWLRMLDGDLQSLLKNPTDSVSSAAVTTLADKAYFGAGGTANPAPVSAAAARNGGVQFAYAEGQLATDLPLAA